MFYFTRDQLALFVLFLILFSITSVQAEKQYSWDFTTEHFDNVSLVPHGPAANKILHPKKDGLHITIPAREKIKFSGFTPRFQVSGDFEISMSWSITTLTKPKEGYGSGPSLYLTTEGKHQPAASLSRLIRRDGRSVYSVFVAREVDGERKISVRIFDTQSKSGILRITRKEKRLIFSVSDSGLEKDFKIIDEQEFNDGTLNLLRAGLQQSDSSARSQIIIPHFAVKANDLLHLPSEQARNEPLYAPRYNPPPKPVSYAWIWQSLIAISIAGGTVFWFVKRQN